MEDSTSEEKFYGKAPGTAYTKDVESDGRTATPPEFGSELTTDHTQLQRKMKSRHIAMISIGGVIGTGLFLGTAGALANGGPLGLLLGYTVVGIICYCVMISLGEMISFLPIPGGHIKLAERFIDPAFSFAMGWNYWYNWVIVLPAELSAASVLIDFWDQNTNLNSLWIAIVFIVVLSINMMGAGFYGEAEFIFCSIKVITITGLIIMGIVLDLGGGPNHDRIGFRYWDHPGPLTQYLGIQGATGRFLGWWAVMSQAAFSYIGTEIVAIAAGETKNPRTSLAKAIKRVYIRILLFYIGGTFVIGLLVPSNSPNLNLTSGKGTAAQSPFVIAIRTAGIQGLPHVVNAAILTSASSAASSDLYTSSRALYGLALAGNAPKIFAHTSRNGLPYISVIFCSLFSFLAYMGVKQGSGTVFGWFQNLTAIAGLMTWFGISVMYIRFHRGFKAQGLDRKSLPFRSPLQPYAAYFGAISCFVLCFFSGFSVFLSPAGMGSQWSTATFVTNYLPLMLFPVMYIGAALFMRVRPKRASEIDFVTGLKEIEQASYPDDPPKNMWEAFWAWLL